jgi:hypothetical protein
MNHFNLEERIVLITIDISELKSERDDLSEFLKSKLQASIITKDKMLVITSEERLSIKNVKEYVKRFFHHRGLSEIYRVIEEKDVIRITERKKVGKRKPEKKGTEPTSYDTLPYFFPNRP